MQAVGGLEAMIDPDCKDKDLLALIRYIAAEDKAQKMLENQAVLKQPIVRNGRQPLAICPRYGRHGSEYGTKRLHGGIHSKGCPSGQLFSIHHNHQFRGS